MGKVAAIIKYKLMEQRNEIAAKPLSLLLWLPRLAFDVAAAVLTYRWLAGSSDQSWSALIFCAVPAFYFIVSLLTIFQKLFSDRQTPLLLAAPFGMRQLFAYKYLESSLFGLEIAVIMGLPLSFAIGHTISPAAGAAVFFSFALNLLIATSLAAIVVLLLTRYAAGRRIVIISTAGLLVAALVGFFIWFAYHGIDPLSSFLISVESLWSYPDSLITLASQVLVATLTTTIGFSLMTNSYYICRSRLSQGQRSERKKRAGKAVSINLFARSYSGSAAIFIKDVMLSLRYPMQWLRIVLTLALIPAYLVVAPALRGASTEFVLAMNVAFASGLIFVFLGESTINAFAAEMNRLRLLLAAPIRPMRIVRAKFLANLLPMIIMSIIVAAATGLMSALPTWAIVLSIVATAATATGFTAVLVGLGALNSKPNKEAVGGMDQLMAEQVLINSPASFAVFLASAAILAVDLAIVFAPFILMMYNIATTAAIVVGLVCAFLAINVGAIILSFKIGSSYLERLPASRG